MATDRGFRDYPINFARTLLPPNQLRAMPSLDDNIPFGRVRTDHMLVCDYIEDKGGWQQPEIKPFGDFQLAPDSLVFHYGQQIFEGMKAYRSPSNPEEIGLFRPNRNAARFYRSAVLMGMQPVPEDLFLASVREMVRTESRWILPHPGALYVRPTLIPLDTGVSVRPSQNYRFFVLVFPAKEYFGGTAGVLVYVERDRARACRGGVGEAKCGGNYAASMSTQAASRAMGADQVVWLDSAEHKYVEEVGAMNVAFIYGKKLVTPWLSGSILHGVTRSSLMHLAEDMGLEVEERRIEIDEVIRDARSGKLDEAFICGTAAVLSPIRAFLDRGETVLVQPAKLGKISLTLKQKLMGVQFGTEPDKFGWRWLVK